MILGDGCCIAPSTSSLALVSMHCSSCCAPRSRTASHSLSSPRRRRQMEGRIEWVSNHSCQQIACKRIRRTFQACRAPHQPRYVRVRVVRLYICEGGALGGSALRLYLCNLALEIFVEITVGFQLSFGCLHPDLQIPHSLNPCLLGCVWQYKWRCISASVQ